MFFKKKESKPTSQPTNNTQTQQVAPQVETTSATENGKPIYQKPVLRRYDQIDQVKPYGPSEI